MSWGHFKHLKGKRNKKIKKKGGRLKPLARCRCRGNTSLNQTYPIKLELLFQAPFWEKENPTEQENVI